MEAVNNVEGGILVFFSSYKHMKYCIDKWAGYGLMR